MTRATRVIACSLCLVASAAGAQGTAAPPPTRPKPFAQFSASAERLRDSLLSYMEGRPVSPIVMPVALDDSALRDSLIALARMQIGTRYRLGASTPGRGFDCSGLVRFVLGILRIDVPRTARTQALVGRPVEKDTTHLRPGDLLTFGRGKSVSHVGIYVGDGRFVHASTTGRRVIESSLQAGSWYRAHWLGARRILASADTTK